MNIKRHIPNLLTLSNLFCGILAVKVGFEGGFYLAAGLIILGAIFDFLDGFVARLLNVSNAIGKELDSLADMVTFGVAPGVLMFSLLSLILNPTDLPFYSDFENTSFFNVLIPYLAFIIPLASAIRLAKFNIDENQSDKFIGLPTPANSLFFMAFPLIYIEYYNNSLSVELLVAIILVFTFLFSWLLNSSIELLALKFKSFGWKNNETRFVFIGLSIIILIVSFLMQIIYLSIPIIILLYLAISIITNYSNLKHKQ